MPIIEVSESRTDFIFLLEDNTYLHFEFQSTHNKSDIIRFASYDLRLHERDNRKVITVIIYPADIKEVESSLNIGSLSYNPYRIMMCEYDGNSIFKELETKIAKKQDLTDIDMINLIFIPLMKNDISKADLAIKSVELAKTIEDSSKRNACIASVFAFASKYLEEENINKLLEVIKMTDLATLLVRDAVKESREEGKYVKSVEIAKNLLRLKTPLEVIIQATGLDESTIANLQK